MAPTHGRHNVKGDLRPRSWLAPGIRTGGRYTSADFRRDLGAGVVLSALLIPVGMGYAEVAGLPPITGLHATVAALVAYAMVGPSRILVLGPDSSLAPIIGAAIVPLAVGAEDRAVALAGLLALLVGAFLILGGLMRLGLITDLLSKPIRLGYLNGVAFVVLVGQLPKLLGFSIDADGLLEGVRELAGGIGDGAVDGPAALIGVGGLATILGLRAAAPRVPGMLVTVVGAAVAVWLFELDGVAVVGARAPQTSPMLRRLTDDPTPFIEWINEVRKERQGLEAQLGRSVPGGTLTKSQVKALISHLRSIVAVLADADPADKAELYGELGVSLTYHRDGRVAVESLPRGADVRVGGGTRALGPRLVQPITSPLDLLGGDLLLRAA